MAPRQVGYFDDSTGRSLCLACGNPALHEPLWIGEPPADAKAPLIRAFDVALACDSCKTKICSATKEC